MAFAPGRVEVPMMDQISGVVVAAPTTPVGVELQGHLADAGIPSIILDSARAVIRRAHNQAIRLIVLDTSFGDMGCETLIPLVREVQRDCPVIVTTSRHSPELEAAVRRCEVTYYAILPDDLVHLPDVVRKNLDPAELPCGA
jgi:DNA-binding NtrC family response regulator